MSGSTSKRDYYYPTSGDEVAAFPSKHGAMVGKLDSDMDHALTGPVAATRVSGTLATGRIPNLPASRINTGTFGSARIPDLPASRVTSGTFASGRIPPVTKDMIDGMTYLDLITQARQAAEEAANRTTGARNITAHITTGYVSGSLIVNRAGRVVTVTASALVLKGDGYQLLCSLPDGFRPFMNITSTGSSRSGNSSRTPTVLNLNIDKSGGVGMTRIDSTSHQVIETYLTDDAWPSTLPGTPA